LAYADDGTPQQGKRRRRRKCVDVEGEETGRLKESAAMEESGDDLETLDSRETRRSKRECPVPKPGGLVGEILGFKGSSSDRKGSRPP
jgi:cytochrome c oxidase assembly factor 2